MKVPITIITGYLGAGKTTLLRNLLETADRKIAVIMNEFGEIGIDGKLLKGKHVDLVELDGGCVCCSLTGEFEAAVKELLTTVKPDHILVETTGVAEPDALLDQLQESLEDVRLDAVVTVVDADAVLKFPSLGQTAKIQIQLADILLINKTDLVSDIDIMRVEDVLRGINSKAVRVKTVKAEVDPQVIFGAVVHHAVKSTPQKHGHEQIESVIYTSLHPFPPEPFDQLVKSLPTSIYRMKGFVVFPKGSKFINYVAGRYEYEAVAAQKTELVFLGKNIQKDVQPILKQLESLHP